MDCIRIRSRESGALDGSLAPGIDGAMRASSRAKEAPDNALGMCMARPQGAERRYLLNSRRPTLHCIQLRPKRAIKSQHSDILAGKIRQTQMDQR
jgi:hypothetical protein